MITLALHRVYLFLSVRAFQSASWSRLSLCCRPGWFCHSKNSWLAAESWQPNLDEFIHNLVLLSRLRRAIYIVPNLFTTNAVNAIQVISEVQLDKAQLNIDKEKDTRIANRSIKLHFPHLIPLRAAPVVISRITYHPFQARSPGCTGTTPGSLHVEALF